MPEINISIIKRKAVWQHVNAAFSILMFRREAGLALR